MNPPASERGAALLSVLLLVAVMAVLAGTVLDRVGLATRLATNAAAAQRLAGFARGAEAIAAVRIADLIAADPSQTPPGGGWLDRPTTIPVPGGSASARLVDGGNCFNLNSVVRAGSEGALMPDPQGMAQFAALAASVGIGANQAAGIAARLGDWIDSDTASAPGGGEGASDTGAIAPDGLLADVSELRAVPGVTADIFARLRPLICALPVTGPSRININTLNEAQAPLLAMLFAGRLPLATARRVIAERPAAGYGSLVRFWDQGTLSALAPEGAVRAQPVLTTRWFLLRLDMTAGGAELSQTTLFDGEQNPVRAVSRSWGEQP